MKAEPSELQRFDDALTKALSVSHEELKRREAEWKKQRKRKKLTKRKT
jgi:hypothetical protein